MPGNARQGKQPEKVHVQREQSRAKGFSVSHKPAESEEAQREKEQRGKKNKDVKVLKSVNLVWINLV
jgi:hypothetical protein